MKKITKLWLLTLGLAGCLVALNASASSGDNKKVSLTLNEWNNSCTIVDYNFWTTGASAEAIELGEKTGDITCLFLANAETTVSLSLANLSGDTTTIPSSNFTFAVAAATSTWTIYNLDYIAGDFSGTIAIYDKAEKTLWSWESILTISWTIPAWTPASTYTGALDLTITESK